MAIRVFLDTDTGNEIDDQFALAYAVRHPALEVVGVGAAFFTSVDFGEPARYTVREGSAETAWQEATKVLAYLGRSDIPVHRGLRGPIASATADEDASREIIRLATAADDPLHVISIGVQSNLAHALRLDPSIASRIRAVFIDGAYPWAPAAGYNLPNDLEAVQLVLDSGCDYLHVPAPNVSGRLLATPELVRGLFVPGDRAGRYLVTLSDQAEIAMETDDPGEAARQMSELFGWHVERAAPILWDVAAITAVASPGLTTVVEDGAPLYEADPGARWGYRVTARPDNPHRVRVVTDLDVPGIWEDYRRAMRLG